MLSTSVHATRRHRKEMQTQREWVFLARKKHWPQASWKLAHCCRSHKLSLTLNNAHASLTLSIHRLNSVLKLFNLLTLFLHVFAYLNGNGPSPGTRFIVTARADALLTRSRFLKDMQVSSFFPILASSFWFLGQFVIALHLKVSQVFHIIICG